MRVFISKQDGVYSFTYYLQNANIPSFDHTLSLPNIIIPEDDDLLRIAVICCPMPTTEYNSLDIHGIKVQPRVLESLEKSYHIKINCELQDKTITFSPISEITNDTKIFLGFSGGFDSLAVKKLLPLCELVSINFGINFKREADFFYKFPTNIVDWNIRQIRKDNPIQKFNESLNWRFMLAPIPLFREKQTSIIIATGTVLEASPWWLNPEPRKTASILGDMGYGAGVSLLRPVAGLSEYGTTKIVLEGYNDKIISESLTSLADANSMKSFRKIVLTAAVKKTRPPTISANYKFGSSLAEDLFTIYFCSKFGKKWIQECYSPNFPDELESLDMRFIEKLNLNNMELIPDLLFKEKLVKTISEYGIEPYTQEDYQSLRTVYDILLKKVS